MPRTILNNQQGQIDLNNQKTVINGRVSDRDLLKQRSRKYIDMISKIDSKTLSDTRGMDELLEAVQKELGSADIISLPIGIVSKCFLGHPYEVHTIDLSGNIIISHFKKGEAMSPDFEKARNLAIHNSYALIEVYKDKMLIIREDGSVSKI
jgi:hypothetical protein